MYLNRRRCHRRFQRRLFPPLSPSQEPRPEFRRFHFPNPK
jgi:hypothetical protein